MHTAALANAPAAEGAAPLTRPQLGQYWPGQGGRYLGLIVGEGGLPPAHLILFSEPAPKALPWKKALAWAETLEADGHRDFRVPTRTESALIYANGRDLVDQSAWHWTSTEYSDGSYAWSQYFYYGTQSSYHKSSEGRARAVRRLPLQSFDPSESAEGQALLEVAERLAFLVNSARLVLTDDVAKAIAASAVAQADEVLAAFRAQRSKQ